MTSSPAGASEDRKVLLRSLETLDFESVLEVGCGFGRIMKLVLDKFPNMRRIKGIDLSPQQIENCQRYIPNLEKVELSTGTIQDLPEADNSYDLVIAIEVLMHIPFGEVELALSQMIRVARKYIVNLDWYRPIPEETGGYCFAHDYSLIYRNLGIQDVRIVPVPRPFVYSVTFGLDEGLKISRFRREQQQIWVATKT